LTSSTEDWLRAGRVASAHGLDGSFYVAEAKPLLLSVDSTVYLAGDPRRIVRRAGTDRRPIIRLEGVADREAAQALRGQELLTPRTEAPQLDEDEWWVEELEGCWVKDGERPVGVVRRVLGLPSCEVLEVARGDRPDLLVPLVGDAVGEVDVQRREIQVDLRFLGEA
jgi:16S rRNA processing protein RimM